MIKTFLISIMAVILLNSNGCNQGKDYFKIISATEQDFYGGRPETGTKTVYKIKIVPFYNSEKLKFDSLWVNNKYLKCSVFQEGKKIMNDKFGKNDTIIVQATVFKSMFDPKRPEKIQTPPVDLKNAVAVLIFEFNGEKKYQVIENFQKLEPVNYP